MNILLVDDHKPTRDEMRTLIESQPGMYVIAEAGSGEEGVERARELHPDVVIMDILMPGMNGVDATRVICTEQAGVKVLALTNHFGESLVQAILGAGGMGFVQKYHAFEELIPALKSVAAGKTYFGKRAIN